MTNLSVKMDEVKEEMESPTSEEGELGTRERSDSKTDE